MPKNLAFIPNTITFFKLSKPAYRNAQTTWHINRPETIAKLVYIPEKLNICTVLCVFLNQLKNLYICPNNLAHTP